VSGPKLYTVLGVQPGATTEELTAAYRQRARLTHLVEEED
jgi:curved DNA-binding protein CbpA